MSKYYHRENLNYEIIFMKNKTPSLSSVLMDYPRVVMGFSPQPT